MCPPVEHTPYPINPLWSPTRAPGAGRRPGSARTVRAALPWNWDQRRQRSTAAPPYAHAAAAATAFRRSRLYLTHSFEGKIARGTALRSRGRSRAKRIFSCELGSLSFGGKSRPRLWIWSSLVWSSRGFRCGIIYVWRNRKTAGKPREEAIEDEIFLRNSNI